MKSFSFLIAAVLLFILGVSSTYSQQMQIITKGRGALYTEAGGNTIYYSINFEAKVAEDFYPRIGFSLIPFRLQKNSKLYVDARVVIMQNYIIDLAERELLELGLGTVGGADNVFNHISLTATVGYRYYFKYSKWFMRFSLAPIFVFGSNKFYPSASIGIGFRIK
jgi:hypothetical protein